jgi:type III secretion protein J
MAIRSVPAARLCAGVSATLQRLLLLVLCALLAACQQLLTSQLSEAEANEMLAVLMAASLQAEKAANDDGSWRVEVDKADFPAAVELIQQQGLPRSKFTTIGDVFKKEGLVSTPNEERIRFIYAMSQELSATLSQIDGVVVARVHPVLPANDPLADKLVPASAAVFIKHQRGADLKLLAPAIKRLVMAGIEGLSYDHIALSFFEVAAPANGSAAAGPAVPARPASGLITGLLSAGGTALLICLLSLAWQRWGPLAANTPGGLRRWAQGLPKAFGQRSGRRS